MTDQGASGGSPASPAPDQEGRVAGGHLAEPRNRPVPPGGRAAAPGGPQLPDMSNLSSADVATVEEVLQQIQQLKDGLPGDG